MVYADIRSIVESRLANWTETPIAWENVPFSALPGVSFIDCHILPGQGEQVTIGETALNRWVGIIDLGVYTPIDKGSAYAWELADALLQLFYHFEQDGLSCRTPYATNLGQSGQWYRVSVSVPFKYDVVI